MGQRGTAGKRLVRVDVLVEDEREMGGRRRDGREREKKGSLRLPTPQSSFKGKHTQ